MALRGNLAPIGRPARSTSDEESEFSSGNARVPDGAERTTEESLSGGVRTGARRTTDALKRQIQMELSNAQLCRCRAAPKLAGFPCVAPPPYAPDWRRVPRQVSVTERMPFRSRPRWPLGNYRIASWTLDGSVKQLSAGKVAVTVPPRILKDAHGARLRHSALGSARVLCECEGD